MSVSNLASLRSAVATMLRFALLTSIMLAGRTRSGSDDYIRSSALAANPAAWWGSIRDIACGHARHTLGQSESALDGTIRLADCLHIGDAKVEGD